ncbi:MAG TPA: alpha/beta hydrolase [Vicinamibacterales bacterium]|jgi:pimeloyl-ACP methyl ester carboxylesterase
MQQFITIAPELRLAYVEQGPASGLPIIFLHGVTDSWRSFEPVLRLLPTDVRAIAISQRGHGDSGKPAAGYGYRDMAGDLRAFMDRRGIASAIVVGHSMGSMVAQRFALDYPERVAGLVLMGSFATFAERPDMTEFVSTTIAPLSDPIGAPFAREWQLSTTARGIDPAFLETVVAETLKVPARVWHAAFDGFLQAADASGQLSRIAAPVLLMWGDRDSYATEADQRRLRAVMPGARAITYQGAGHAIHWEDPSRIASDLLSFVFRLTAMAA